MNEKMNNRWKKTTAIVLMALMAMVLSACEYFDASGQVESVSLGEIPEFSGEPYVVIDDNEPNFSPEDLTEEAFEEYSSLDSKGRCGVTMANVGLEIMPTEKRTSIGQVKPTGWQIAKYDFVDGKYLYNRCHLIGFQLTGENANERNLITGTRYMNVDGMLPFENLVADYVRETGNHVLYRVTPIYEGNNLVASGVQMEAMSVEDDGEGVLFNVFVYNNQPGVTIDYATGDNRLSGEAPKEEQNASVTDTEIRGNRRSKIYHCPGQRAYEEMADSNNLIVFETEQEAKDAGYRKAQK
ncbi:DNA-entry nuclease [Clostridiales Family XIII bacterium PM5-7]